MARDNIADQFSEDEMAQIQRYGQALHHGGPTDFDEEVERHLADHAAHEKGYKKMKAAQTGGSLAPSEMEKTAATQAGAIGQQASRAGQVQATQAQGAQAPSGPPPAAPGGPAGVSQPYAAQRGETPPGVPERGAKAPEQAPEIPEGEE